MKKKNPYPRIRNNGNDDYSFRSMLLDILSKRSFHVILLSLLITYYSVVYYFGEIVDLTGWEYLRWEFFYGVHDIHRLFFLIPVIYTGYVFRIKWSLIVTFAAFLVFLPRALFISPFSDPLIRIVLFTLLSGIIGTLTGLFRNESERRSSLEKTVKTERDKMLGILNRMEDGVLITGPDYIIRFMNPSMEREFGNGIGIRCYEYLQGLKEPCSESCCLNNPDGPPERREYSFNDGRTYDVILSPYIDTDGAVCQLSTFRNISQRKKVENDLKELNKMKSELLSNVSHELRSPLTSIKGTISSLLQKDITLSNEDTDMLLTGVSEETDRLISLVTNLLNMSRLEAGAWDPDRESCYIQDIINEVLERQKWSRKKRVFKSDIEPDLPPVFADSTQIRQVIMNLVENAVAYSEEGSTIDISARTDGAMVQVSVTDNGDGIPPEDIEKVFDKFYRGSQNRHQPGGTGLGLAICKSIIDNHGGKIWVESKPGQGSVFNFTLPTARSEEKNDD
ncbi:MAG: ATP-binding protein [Dehalococcoidales bacterium]|nr:ATP-binding protein [Dehalococcoidales bacterium]